MDLQVLAIVVPELGFLHRKAGDLLGAILPGHGPYHRGNQLVHLRLGVVFNVLLCRSGARHHIRNFFSRFNEFLII